MHVLILGQIYVTWSPQKGHLAMPNWQLHLKTCAKCQDVYYMLNKNIKVSLYIHHILHYSIFTTIRYTFLRHTLTDLPSPTQPIFWEVFNHLQMVTLSWVTLQWWELNPNTGRLRQTTSTCLSWNQLICYHTQCAHWCVGIGLTRTSL